MLQW